MAKIRIDRDRCKACGLCILYCPKGLISMSNSLNNRGLHPAAFHNRDTQCIGCMLCAQICPDVAIEVYK